MGAKKLTYYNKTNHYYPFGMLLPNRHEDAGEYRYGFNGMEKDDEVAGGGNSYSTYFRAYDSRIARWKSLDPMANKFPWQSPYVAFDNNPIYFTDPNGGETDNPDDRMKRLMARSRKLQNAKTDRKRAKAAKLVERALKIRQSKRYSKWLTKTQRDSYHNNKYGGSVPEDPITTYDESITTVTDDQYHTWGYKIALINDKGELVVSEIGVPGMTKGEHGGYKAVWKEDNAYGMTAGDEIFFNENGDILDGKDGNIIIPLTPGVDVNDGLYGVNDEATSAKYKLSPGETSAVIRTTFESLDVYRDGYLYKRTVIKKVNTNVTKEIEEQNR